MPAKIPWKTQVVGPSFGRPVLPISVPPSGVLAAAPSAKDHRWAMAATPAYNAPGGITGVSMFGHADASTAAGTVLDIPGNDSGAMTGPGDGMVVIAADTGGLYWTISDTKAGSWGVQPVGGGDGIYIYEFRTFHLSGGLVAGDVITVTADRAARMIGAAFMIGNPGNGFGAPPVNHGYGKQAWIAFPGAECFPVVASPDVMPQDPAGMTRAGQFSGKDLFCTVSWGTPVLTP